MLSFQSAPSATEHTYRFVSCRTPPNHGCPTTATPALQIPAYSRLPGERSEASHQIRTAMFSAFKRAIVRDLSALATTANPGLAPNIHLVRTRKTSSHPYSHTAVIVRGYPAPIERSNSFVLPLAAHILLAIPRVRSSSTSKSSPVSRPRTSSGLSSLTYLMAV